MKTIKQMNDDELQVEIEQLDRLLSIGKQCREDEGFNDETSEQWMEDIEDELNKARHELWCRITT